jgi:hypothetical protein
MHCSSGLFVALKEGVSSVSPDAHFKWQDSSSDLIETRYSHQTAAEIRVHAKAVSRPDSNSVTSPRCLSARKIAQIARLTVQGQLEFNCAPKAQRNDLNLRFGDHG